MTDVPLTHAERFASGAIATLVNKSCDMVGDALFSGQKKMSENEINAVKSNLCGTLEVFASAATKGAFGQKISNTDMTIMLMKKGVNFSKFSNNQTVLCVGSLIGLSLATRNLYTESVTTMRDIRGATFVGLYFGAAAPTAIAIGSSIAIAAHAPDLYRNYTSISKAAESALEQCLPLFMYGSIITDESPATAPISHHGQPNQMPSPLRTLP